MKKMTLKEIMDSGWENYKEKYFNRLGIDSVLIKDGIYLQKGNHA